MRQQLLGWKRVKQWMIAAIAAVQHEISTSQPTFLSFAFQRVFWRFWGVDSSAWKKSYCRMLGLSLQIQILFNPLWPWGSQENLRKTVKPRSPELASIEACWTTDDQRKRQLCTLQLASTFACRIQRFFLQSNNVLYSLTSDVLVLVALILAIALKFFLFVCPKSSGNNPMDVMDIMDVLSWLHPHSNPGWPKGTTTSQCMGVKGAIRLMLRACLVNYQRLALWYIFTKRWYLIFQLQTERSNWSKKFGRENLGFTMISFWSGAKQISSKNLRRLRSNTVAFIYLSFVMASRGTLAALKAFARSYVHLEGTPLKINMEPEKKHTIEKENHLPKLHFLGSMVYSSSISLRKKIFRNSFDMRLMKNNIALLYPDAIFLCSQSNEDLPRVKLLHDVMFFLNPSCSANGLGCWFGPRWFWDSKGSLKK